MSSYPELYDNIRKILKSHGKTKLTNHQLFELAIACKHALKEAAYHHHWKDVEEEKPEEGQHCRVTDSPFEHQVAPAMYSCGKFYATVDVSSAHEVCWYWARYWK